MIRSLIAMCLMALATVAHAGIIVLPSVGGAPLGVSYANFDNLPIGNAAGISGGIGVSFGANGGVAVIPNVPGVYAAPFISNSNGVPFGDATVNGQDATHYLTAGTSSVTLDMPGEMQYVGLLWGSVDLYNTLSLYKAGILIGNGTTDAIVTGSMVDAAASGDQSASGTYYVNIISTLKFDRVVLTSSQFAFEADNVAYNPAIPKELEPNGAVPEPTTLAIWGTMLIGLAMRKRYA